MLYQMVELKEGVGVQYFGVYALKWRHDEWGPPSVGFVERSVFDLRVTYTCAHCGILAEVPFLEVGVFDSGTTLTCVHCGEDTVFDLGTGAEERIKELEAALQEIWEEVQGDFDRDIIYTAAKNVVG